MAGEFARERHSIRMSGVSRDSNKRFSLGLTVGEEKESRVWTDDPEEAAPQPVAPQLQWYSKEDTLTKSSR